SRWEAASAIGGLVFLAFTWAAPVMALEHTWLNSSGPPYHIVQRAPFWYDDTLGGIADGAKAVWSPDGTALALLVVAAVAFVLAAWLAKASLDAWMGKRPRRSRPATGAAGGVEPGVRSDIAGPVGAERA